MVAWTDNAHARKKQNFFENDTKFATAVDLDNCL